MSVLCARKKHSAERTREKERDIELLQDAGVVEPSSVGVTICAGEKQKWFDKIMCILVKIEHIDSRGQIADLGIANSIDAMAGSH